MAAVTVCSDSGAQENKVYLCFHCFPSICHEVMGPDAMILVFWMLSFKPSFSLSSFTFIKRLFSSSSLSFIRVLSSAYLKLLIVLLAIIAICKASSDSHFAFLHFFFLGMILITASYTMPWTSIHSSSGTLSIRSNPLNLFVTSTV